MLAPTSTQFNKPALTTAQHLVALQARNLWVPNQAEAEDALRRIGYQRLLPYMRSLQNAQKNFNPGIEFNDIVALYDFDRKLRLLCLDALERIEICMRSLVIETLCVSYGPHFYTERAYFSKDDFFKDTQRMALSIKHITVDHYMSKYTHPPLPSFWCLSEGMMFGQLSKFYSGLTTPLQSAIAHKFRYPVEVVISWFRAMTTFRNQCAHHNKIWNMQSNVDAPKRPSGTSAARENPETNRLHARLVATIELLKIADPSSDWKHRFISLVDGYAHLIDETEMGLTLGWRQRPFWQ